MSKGKKIHFNIIDILIILCFVVLIGGFSFYATGNWQTNVKVYTTDDNHIVRYTIIAEDILPEVADAITVGDIVKDSSKETVKGTIAEIISNEPYTKTNFNSETGVFVQAKHPENRTVVLAIESSYVLNDNTAMIDDMEVKVGKKIHYKTPGYAFEGYITDVNKTEK